MQLSSFSFLPLQFGAKKAAKPKTEAPKSVKPLAPTQFANKFEEAVAGIETILEQNKIGGYAENRQQLDDVLVHLDQASDRDKTHAAFKKAGMEVRLGGVRDNITFFTQDRKQVSVGVTVPQKVFTY